MASYLADSRAASKETLCTGEEEKTRCKQDKREGKGNWRGGSRRACKYKIVDFEMHTVVDAVTLIGIKQCKRLL